MTIDEFSTISIIDSMSNQFTKTDWKIVQFIKNQSKEFIQLSAAEIADRVGTSDASVIRFAQKIGFSGINELKLKFQKELIKAESKPINDGNEQFQQDYDTIIRRLFALCEQADMDFLIQGLKKAPHIYVVAFKQSNYVAHFFADKLLTIGVKMKAITSMNEFKLYVSNAKSQDLFVVFGSHIADVELAHELKLIKQNHADIALISFYQQSKSANISDLNLMIPKTSDLFSEYAISNNVLTLILIDILFNALFQSDTDQFGKILIQSTELTKRDDDNDLNGMLHKIEAFFE